MSNPSNSPFLVIFIFSLLSTSLDFFFPPEYKNHKEHRGSMEINGLLFLSLTPQIQPDSFALTLYDSHRDLDCFLVCKSLCFFVCFF